jgi:hypothetical protein
MVSFLSVLSTTYETPYFITFQVAESGAECHYYQVTFGVLGAGMPDTL